MRLLIPPPAAIEQPLARLKQPARSCNVFALPLLSAGNVCRVTVVRATCAVAAG